MNSTAATVLLLCLFYCKGTFGASIGAKNFSKSGRVIGGDDIKISEAPYQVAIQTLNDLFIGGGSILNKHLVLTSASAVQNHDSNELAVRVGSNMHYMSGQYVHIRYIYYHPQFNHSDAAYDYDAAILLLNAALDISLNLDTELVKIPPVIGFDAGLPVDVTGWGSTSFSFVSLTKISIQILDAEECKTAFGDQFTDTMLCAGDSNGDKHACSYDVGGPMVLQGTNLLLGIVSFGDDCFNNRPSPIVFTNVAHPAIQSFIKEYLELFP